VSASKIGLSNAPKRKPYNRPTVTKLTPEEAKTELDSNAATGCENAQRLLAAVKLRLGQNKGKASGAPQAGILRQITFVAVLVLLFAVPAVLLVAAVSDSFALRDTIVRLTVFWFPVWAVFTVWVSLDAVALYGFVGPRPDPLGPKALGLSALGVANIGAMFLFLILTRGR
jgi:hypothetical protein